MILFNLHKKRWWYNDTHLNRRPKDLRSSISCSGLSTSQSNFNACKSHLEGLLRRRSWATLPLSKSVGLGGDWELFQTSTQMMVVMLAQGPTFENPFLRGRSGIQTRWEVFYMSLPIAFPTIPTSSADPVSFLCWKTSWGSAAGPAPSPHALCSPSLLTVLSMYSSQRQMTRL